MHYGLLMAILFLGICIVIVGIYNYFKTHASLSLKDKERLFRIVLTCGILAGIVVISNVFSSGDYKNLFALALPLLVINLAFQARRIEKREEL